MLKIMSDNAEKILEEKGSLTPFNRATLIWNAPGTTWEERIKALVVLSTYTDDNELSEQITMRILYEEVALSKFHENPQNHFIYVVFDKNNIASGYFKEYDDAHKYGIRICEEYEIERFTIEKQLVYCNESKDDIAQHYISKRCKQLDLSAFDFSEYNGRENASAYYNAKGEMLFLYSNEMSEVENERVDNGDRSRFEYQFFKIPSVVDAGTIAKIMYEDKYVVVDDSMSTWSEYMERANPGTYDFSDIQNPVHVLKEDGTWRHDHINPIYLEPGIPEACDKKTQAYVNALIKMSEYLREMNEENDRKVLDACKYYAELCSGMRSSVYRARSIEDCMS